MEDFSIRYKMKYRWGVQNHLHVWWGTATTVFVSQRGMYKIIYTPHVINNDISLSRVGVLLSGCLV